MIAICARTTGYSAVIDLRYLRMRRRRFQGWHFANDRESAAFNQTVVDGKVDPCRWRVCPFTEIGEAHQVMRENRHLGGLTDLPDTDYTG